MSSSDEGGEFFETSPVEPVTQRRNGNGLKAHSPSPKKVPMKMQMEVGADFNVELEDDEEEEQGRRRNPKSVHQGKRKRAEASFADSNLEEEGDRKSSSSSEKENRHPPASSNVASLADEIPEESSQPADNGDGQIRSEKRLSIRSDSSGDGRRSSISGTSGVESVVGTPSEVHTIYGTCSQMFNANRIDPQSAFNLRLLDCINQMINSPGYDKSNMQLTSSTVEIGTKIYVCRVDNTHSQVLSLDSDINVQQPQKKKDGNGEGEGEGENQEDNAAGRKEEGEDGLGDDEANATRSQRQQKKVIKKRGRFVEADNAKLLTGLEEQNVTRRTLRKKKFNQMIYDDLEFEYLSKFLEPEDEYPHQTKKESENLKHQFKISDVYTHATEMGKLEFLPFSHLPKFDPETHDVWGRPLNKAEELRHQFSQEPQPLAINDEFAYHPADRPAKYPDKGAAGHMMNDTLGKALPHFGDRDEGAHDIPVVSFDGDDIEKVRSVLKTSKSKYGCFGPYFVDRPKTAIRKGPKKPRVTEEPARIDFTKADWNDPANKFNPLKAAEIVFDDKVIKSWSEKKTVIPSLNIEEETSYDNVFDPLSFKDENDANFVPTILKLCIPRNRSILDILKTSEKRRQSSGGSFPPPNLGDDGFDHDNDIEPPRDIVEDFCSQQTNEDGYHPAGPDGATQADAGWQSPSCQE